MFEKNISLFKFSKIKINSNSILSRNEERMFYSSPSVYFHMRNHDQLYHDFRNSL